MAIGVGLVAGITAFALIGRPDYVSDFFHYWTATRTLIAGGDPYAPLAASPMNPGGDPALYPLPAFLLLAPVAWLPLALAGALFCGFASGSLAWGVARTGAERLPLFLSAPFLLTLSLGQWSPLVLAAVLVPALGVCFAAKPNIGLGAFAARPSVSAVLAGLAILVVSLVVLPDWPQRWLANISDREEKFIPLLRPSGFLLALALIGWRRPEGRLMITLALVPQALFFYDQLLLWLVPRTLRQSLLLSIWSVLAFLLWRRGLQPGDFEVQEAVPFAFTLYLAALAILLWNWFADRRATNPQQA